MIDKYFILFLIVDFHCSISPYYKITFIINIIYVNQISIYVFV